MEVTVQDFNPLYPYKLKTKKPFAIMYKASWCGHCKTMTPVWEQVRSKILFLDVHTFTVDAAPENADWVEKINKSLEKGSIEGFPTFMFCDKKGNMTKMEGSGITFGEFLEKCKSLV